jgi:hypothetical protein
VRTLPANQASFDDIQTVFGTRGPAHRCQCQRYKLKAREAFAKFPVEPRRAYEGLLRNNRVPSEGRDEDKADGR